MMTPRPPATMSAPPTEDGSIRTNANEQQIRKLRDDER